MSAKTGTSRAAARKNGTGKIEVNPAIVVDLSAWYMDDYLRWAEAGQTTGLGGVQALNAIMATAIVEWPFAGDPRDVEAYRKRLRPYEWKEAVAAVEAATATAFQRPNQRGDQSAEVRTVGSRANGSGGADEPGEDDPDAEANR